MDFKKAHNSFGREMLYNILIEFDVPMELVRPIKMCLNETYSKSVDINICLIIFLSKMVSNYEVLYPHCFSALL
jgi:hypothetical protein